MFYSALSAKPERKKRTPVFRRSARLLMGAVLPSMILLGSLTPVANAQQDTQSRLQRLENDIDTLSRAVFKGDIPATTAGATGNASERAAIEVRLSDLERDIRSLTGQLEQQQYEMRQFREEIRKKLDALELQITQQGTERALPTTEKRLEKREEFSPLPGQSDSGTIKAEQPVNGLSARDAGTLRADETTIHQKAAPESTDAATDTQTPPTKSLGQLTRSESGDTGTVQDDPVAAYEKAFTYLKDSDFENAEKEFKTFLDSHGDHSLAPNAQYWLGETYYVRGNYEQAARIFARAYQQYPEGPKGPDNLLKLALSLDGLEKREDACLTLQQLIKEYPSGAGPVIVRAEQELKRLNCP